MDGKKFVLEGFEVKEVVIVILGGKNVNFMLVEVGWVFVICYCKDDID